MPRGRAEEEFLRLLPPAHEMKYGRRNKQI